MITSYTIRSNKETQSTSTSNPRIVRPQQIQIIFEVKNLIQKKTEKENIEPFIEFLERNGIKMFVITDISKDGMMEGINETSINSILNYITTNAIISGGVTTIDDVKTILAMNKSKINGMIIGKALYENKIRLSEAINECS